MYGPQLSIYSAAVNPPGVGGKIWDANHQLKPSDTQANYQLVRWGQLTTPADIMFLATPEYSHFRNLGPAIILLTDRGFFLVWYPFMFYKFIGPGIDHVFGKRRQAEAELRKEVQNAVAVFKDTDASLLDIIAFVFTAAEESIFTGEFMDTLLDIIYTAAQSLPSLSEEPEKPKVMLLLGSISLPSIQQRFIIASRIQSDTLTHSDILYFTIYYAGLMQFQVSFAVDERLQTLEPPQVDLTRLLVADLGTLASGYIDYSSDGNPQFKIRSPC